MHCCQNAWQNHDMKIADRSYETVVQFKCQGTTITDQNLIQEEIKRRLNSATIAIIQSRNFCLLVYCVKLKNQNIQNYNFAMVCVGVKLCF
jgi:hypothetical protein